VNTGLFAFHPTEVPLPSFHRGLKRRHCVECWGEEGDEGRMRKGGGFDPPVLHSHRLGGPIHARSYELGSCALGCVAPGSRMW
jgi:hypothetical protein